MLKARNIGVLAVFIVIVIAVLKLSSCYKGPENLPKLKKNFRAQISKFEKQKNETNEEMGENLEKLGSIEQALENAKNVDKEFKRVYNRWNGVKGKVEGLTKEYDGLVEDATNLFDALDRQVEGLKSAERKSQLSKALNTVRNDYMTTLKKTEVSISKLKGLYDEATDVIQSLEVAVALGEFKNFQSSLGDIEAQVPAIMEELNDVIAESKSLYEKKIGSF